MAKNIAFIVPVPGATKDCIRDRVVYPSAKNCTATYCPSKNPVTLPVPKRNSGTRALWRYDPHSKLRQCIQYVGRPPRVRWFQSDLVCLASGNGNGISEEGSPEEPTTVADSPCPTIEVRLPESVEESVLQAIVASHQALTSGCNRLQIDIFLPEVAQAFNLLNATMPVAYEFGKAYSSVGKGLKVVFPDAGAAALARSRWPDAAFSVASVQDAVSEADQMVIFVCPDSYQVKEVERISDEVAPAGMLGGRCVMMLNPNLEDLAVVGLGYAARQIRDRFLASFEKPYYLLAGENYALFRFFPRGWMLFAEEEATNDYRLIAEEEQRPDADRIQQLLRADAVARGIEEPSQPSQGLLAGLAQFFKALSS